MRKTAITPKKAKEITLEVWEYLAEHSEIDRKYKLPERLYAKIRGMASDCPLCELFAEDSLICPSCPLGRCDVASPFQMWQSTYSKYLRKHCAQEIADKIRAWEPGAKPLAAKERRRRGA